MDALERVRGKIEYDLELAASFLHEPFTIPELRRVYEAVWGGPLHRADFRRKMVSADGLLIPTGEVALDTRGASLISSALGRALDCTLRWCVRQCCKKKGG